MSAEERARLQQGAEHVGWRRRMMAAAYVGLIVVVLVLIAMCSADWRD